MNYEATIPSDGEQGVSHGDALETLAGDSDEARRSRRKVWIVSLGALALIVALWFMMHGKDAPVQQAEQAAVVSVIAPGRSTVTGEINATGTLAARREMPVGSVGEGGQVVRVLVEQGDWVDQGQVLAVVDRSVQAQQQASLAAQIGVAEADARLAQANLDRALKLVDRGFISKADVDRLTATRDGAVSRVRVARAQASEQSARNARLNIVAPASGLVLTRAVEPGQVVGAGTGVLFSIARGGELELLARVGESDLAKLSVGTQAKVVPVGSNKTFSGQVWQLSPTIDEQSRQGTARIALAYDPALRPGGFASATIASGTVVAPMLPESAILSDERGSYVYIVGKDKKVERRTVRTGLVTDAGITIAEGLNGTEAVVLRAGGFLAPGQTVEPKRVTSAKAR